MNSEQERSLLARCRAGDRVAFEALFAAHRDQAYRLARQITNSRADADDVLQTAWLRALRGISRFRGSSRFRTWFWRILIHVGVDHERRARRQASVGSLDGSVGLTAAVAEADPLENTMLNELKDALREAMSLLPSEQRAALSMITYDDMSYAQVARVLGCPEGTVAWRIAEARRKLAQQMAPYLESGED